jgi:hypothetical protein
MYDPYRLDITPTPTNQPPARSCIPQYPPPTLRGRPSPHQSYCFLVAYNAIEQQCQYVGSHPDLYVLSLDLAHLKEGLYYIWTRQGFLMSPLIERTVGSYRPPRMDAVSRCLLFVSIPPTFRFRVSYRGWSMRSVFDLDLDRHPI